MNEQVVWIVEHREETPEFTDVTVMHVASSLELAEAWIRAHADAGDGEWHWWIGKDLVDNPGVAWDHDWRTYYPDGTRRCE